MTFLNDFDPARWKKEGAALQCFVDVSKSEMGKDRAAYILPMLGQHGADLLKLDCFKHVVNVLRMETSQGEEFLEDVLHTYPFLAPFVRYFQ